MHTDCTEYPSLLGTCVIELCCASFRDGIGRYRREDCAMYLYDVMFAWIQA